MMSQLYKTTRIPNWQKKTYENAGEKNETASLETMFYWKLGA